MMQRVAITGCASRFGRVLLPLLEADPDIERIVGVDLVAPVGTYSKLEFHTKDVRDTSLQEAFQGCDTVVHLAFIVGRPYSMSLQEAASINLGGTWNVCYSAAEIGVRKLVVSSSIAAYGSLPDNPPLFFEDSSLRGLYTDFYYSQHKHANEIWLDSLQLKYPQLLISRLRPSIVIGPHQVAATSMIQPNRTYFTSNEAYQSRLQLIHEDDLAAAFYVMITHDLPGAYNVVADDPNSMPNIAASAGFQVIEVPAEMIVQAVDAAWKEGKTTLGPEWVTLEGDIICSNAKLKETGLWTPRYTTAQAYAATAEVVASADA
ncbi:MAG: NAD-dependent epimerase/dehydratase family protein [Ktedonobacteraceae bacterium]